MEEFKLDKWIWTDKDLEVMGWHDATVYGLRLHGSLDLDIDYIFKWNQPEMDRLPFTFWVAPATLIFELPTELTFDLSQLEDSWFEIEDIELEMKDGVKWWTIITRQGNISFGANSFKQVIRQKPSFQFGQSIPYDERGGYSFDLTPGDESTNELKPEILERRRKDLAHYETAVKRFALKRDLVLLSEGRDSGQLQTKDFLEQKNSIKSKINAFNLALHGTRFEAW